MYIHMVSEQWDVPRCKIANARNSSGQKVDKENFTSFMN